MSNGRKLRARFWPEGRQQKSAGETDDARRKGKKQLGFTLLEVMICLTVLAVGVALALSLISGSLGNIRKVQLKTRTVEHAEAVMELALLDDSITQPRTYSGDFEDGTRFSVNIADYSLPETNTRLQPPGPQQNIQFKLLCYTVEMFDPNSRASDYQLQTLKLIRVIPEDQLKRVRP